MKILLFNDNPVVRKLVALSAQKTKDDLSVVWSVEEIEGSEYDLLIMDDALYSDDTFEALNNKIDAKSKLLMATRGNSVPEGFDHVINKPFLPTDLVDLLIHIEKKVAGLSTSVNEAGEKTTPVYSINLEDSLPELDSLDEPLHDIEGIDEEEFDFGNLEELDEKLPETNVLDQEEVQEVQGLLEDTEAIIEGEEEILVQDIHAPEIDEMASADELLDESDFGDIADTKQGDEELDFDDLLDEPLKNSEEIADKEILDEDEFGALELPSDFEDDNSFEEIDASSSEPLDFEEEAMTDEIASMDDLSLDESMLEDMELPEMSDEENYLDELEAKINSAVNTLESADLDQELSPEDLDESLMADLDLDLHDNTEEQKEEMSGLDELDMLDERELKRAIGEEMDEDDDTLMAEDEFSDPMDSVEHEYEITDEVSDQPVISDSSTAHPEGVEALQALLKALSNEDVAKSLKGMNISININFGNDK
jgi:uncharacterized membrane protein